MMTRTIPARVASTCPVCEGTFETCRCTGGVAPLGRPRAGVADDIRREDDRGGHDGRGYERDESDRFHQLARQLTAEGDGLAAAAGRQAFAQMAPGTTRQPVLLMTWPLTFTPSPPSPPSTASVPAGPVAGRACGDCGGAGGKSVDTSGDGVSRQHWQTCTSCSGTGVAR
ncbi:hypothetical protein [Streptomyces sp. MMG1522]|uniref:hypothetical protein n=1 Tax=Streptomyces sp. MMG1522 TaxID=1415545 RepID=UPI0018FE45B1|nr:hypothetical protein [Streptomyces sp. MMG1522]